MANRRLWMFNPGGATIPCCAAPTVPTVACPGPCGTVWPTKLYVTDMNGTHQLLWNGGTGWVGCYTYQAESSNLTCVIGIGPVAVRYGLNCPTSGGGGGGAPGDPVCETVSLFMDYEIKDCNFALGAYYLSRYKACGQIVNRSWVATSTSYTRSPVTASWTVPATRLEFGTTYSPLPVHGTITLSE